MDVLFLGVDSRVASLLRKHLGSQATSKIRVHSLSADGSADLQSGRWDVMILGANVRFHPRLAELVKHDRLQGLKLVLTDKDDLQPTIEFWGTHVYSYFLTPINRELFQLLWQNVVERIDLSKKLSRLSKQHKKHRAGALEQQEVVKSLFTTHLQLQELNQEKTNLLARTSHELLTPLTALQGYLQLLANGQAGPVNELQFRIAKSALDSCERLLRLARSLTDLGVLDQNAEAFLQLDTADIGECLSRSVSELDRKIKAKKIHLEVELAELPKFRFDFDRMEQVLINLLDNAVKFTPEDGTVHIRCSPHFWDRRTVREMVYVQQERRGNTPPIGINSVRVVVKDTGIGIPAEFLQDIFEEYSRVSNDNGTPRGFGLGLAVSRRIILAHQGKIWAESKPGHGSSFTALIPL